MSDTISEIAEGKVYYWFFLCDNRARDCKGRTEFEVVRDSLREIHLERPDLFLQETIKRGKSAIQCISTESKMRKAAEYLRSKVRFPFCISGFLFKEVPPFQLKYLHTFDGEFYKWNEHGWKKDQLGNAKDSFEVEESKISSMQPCSVPNSTDVVLPSQVFDKEFVYFPSSEDAIPKMREGKGGKWMLHSPGCMNMHDSYWLALVNLCRIGLFVGVKASTAMTKESKAVPPGGFRREDPVIMCYTLDSGDKSQVGRAADAIREVVKCDLVLYYKTNSASNSGRYYHEGSRNVSRYMHTVEGELYERDQMRKMRWVKY